MSEQSSSSSRATFWACKERMERARSSAYKTEHAVLNQLSTLGLTTSRKPWMWRGGGGDLSTSHRKAWATLLTQKAELAGDRAETWSDKCNELADAQVEVWRCFSEDWLSEPDALTAAADAKRRAQLRDQLDRAERLRSRPNPPPPAQKYGVSPRGAELLVEDWMRHLGLKSATVSRYTQDGGIDVESNTYVAQVKHQAGTVGAPDVQKLFGAATSKEKLAVFFASATYSAQARIFADSVNLPLIIFRPELGELSAANSAGALFVEGVEE